MVKPLYISFDKLFDIHSNLGKIWLFRSYARVLHLTWCQCEKENMERPLCRCACQLGMEHKIAKCGVVKTLQYSFVWKMHCKFTRVCNKMGIWGRLLYEQKRIKVFMLRFPYCFLVHCYTFWIWDSLTEGRGRALKSELDCNRGQSRTRIRETLRYFSSFSFYSPIFH